MGLDFDVLVTGFSLSISLILAIGAQNAFVLKQGLKKHHVFWVCLVCAVSDALLISAGVGGFGVMIESYPQIEVVARYAGAIFLFVYSAQSFRSAFTAEHQLTPEGESTSSLWKTLGVCLALTWLNPHVYLDTVVLLGSISTQYAPSQLSFGVGAVMASFVFFFSLGYGARLLIPLFSKSLSWKILEAVVGCIMLVIAMSLVWR
ncbi:amino acid transporter [Vibrio sp. 10N.286.49.C2]|uniref:LysE/ArgO family amino acid transporter n=1 Tax=unclassified Vibrio TaxID=2614977 RepID=UPI000C830F3F|nr:MULTISPECIES: LysE/ArgO family amino acid transporter [unclassified Vibrio]PMH37246.1 amino acid transporter [Vibrio sp. 10N.286.49.C2]PMH57391.1 amino acid transporter [Vibrio sp. 10N.286.49.B1]